MPRLSALVPRGLTLVVVGMAVMFGAMLESAVARAHVRVAADHPVRGVYAIVTFQVPNESERGSATTKVTIGLPNSESAAAGVIPGWTTVFDRVGGAGAFRSVTFVAASSGIGAGQFQMFAVSMRLPDVDAVLFPVIQTYADGTTVHWDQPRPSNGPGPEFPAPVLVLAAGPADPPERHRATSAPPAPAGPVVSAVPAPTTAAVVNVVPDTTARALAGAALLVAAIGVGVALARRRS